MTQPNYQPTRRERLRPAEYVGGAAIASAFVGIIVFAATRNWLYTAIAVGSVFIVVLVVLALLQMALKPDAFEQAEIGQGGVLADPPQTEEGAPSAPGEDLPPRA